MTRREARQTIDQRANRLLWFWGLWRWRENNPGVGFDHQNTIAKMMKRSRLEWEGGAIGPTDWSDALRVDEVVRKIRDIAPHEYHALLVKYHHDPEMPEGEKRREWELRAFRSRIGSDVSPMKFRADVRNGRGKVAFGLALTAEAA